ncbi:hypothetical protein QVO34_33200, partial [Pseudomonas aeruginosa]|uniref:hypothetical protein n=1 Tax=Pseudomonas aeruginosa TaxID=287 RepID=UPI00352525FD
TGRINTQMVAPNERQRAIEQKPVDCTPPLPALRSIQISRRANCISDAAFRRISRKQKKPRTDRG